MDELNYKELIAHLKQYFTLQLDYSKLTITEKLSVLLSRVLLVAVCVLAGVVILFFLASSLVTWLAEMVPAALANLIVALLLLALLFIAIISRKSLIINPVTRFVAALFFNPNTDDAQQKTPSTTQSDQ